MRIEYAPNLVEQTVFLVARQHPQVERQVHAAVDPIYALPAGQEREANFRQTYGALFVRLGLDGTLSSLLAERPLIAVNVATCIVRDAGRRKAESAELLVKNTTAAQSPADRTLVIQVCPDSLLEPQRLAVHMRRELLHVADMLDVQFQYAPEAIDGLPPRRNLILDRYRVLWDIYVEGRLSRQGMADETVTKKLEAGFRRIFRHDDAKAWVPAFDRVLRATNLTHPQLLTWAGRPDRLFDENATVEQGMGKGPGEACPLCGFPTHEWFGFSTHGGGPLAKAICLDHPDWSPQNGACRQCAEMYAAAAGDSFHAPAALELQE